MISLSFAKCKELQAAGVDLLADRRGGDRLANLFQHPDKLAVVLWLLVCDSWQAKLYGIDFPAFLETVDGDTLEQGGQALLDAYIQFLPEVTKPTTGDGDGEPTTTPWQSAVNLGAVAGVDIWPLSFRQLALAADSKQSNEWDHTAALRMEIRNAAFGRKSATQFRDVHPFIDKKPKARMNGRQSRQTLDTAFKAWRGRK